VFGKLMRRLGGGASDAGSRSMNGAAGAAFTGTPDDRERLDWKLLQNGAIALYYKQPVLAEDSAWLQAHGYTVYTLDCAKWSTPAAMHADLKRVLGFPDYYAGNLASLIDSLAELDVPPAGCALQLRRFDAFATHDRALAQTLLDVLETTSRNFLLTGRRFVALVQSDNPRLGFERVGARPVTWNPREWLDTARGIGKSP
jgi:RNAse (barnase) inhibitor barstar